MCGRYVTISKVEVIQKKFGVNLKPNFSFEPNYNIGVGQYAPVITQENPYDLQLFKFGFSPSWAKKPMYLFNARSEGDGNKENATNYSGGMGIISKPAFRQSIRNKRCLVIADCFYEGHHTLGLEKPYLCYVRDRRPFAFAGIYNAWVNQETGEITNTFAIITSYANELMQKVEHHRSPVILHEGAERKWLKNDASLGEVTRMLQPYPAELMNAYPVSKAVKNIKNNSNELVQPLGERIYPEHHLNITSQTHVLGMKERRKDLE